MVPFLVLAALLEGSSAVKWTPSLAKYKRESLYELCSGPGLTLDANGHRSAVYVVAERPRRALSNKCSFSVRANNSDGVVISLQKMNLRPSTAVDGVCLDYIEFKGESGRVHTTSCGQGVKSYDMPVPLTVHLFTNPTQYYTPGEIISFVLTGFNKTTQEDCKGGSFTCSNARCIYEGFACDGIDNCGDISDESNAVDCAGAHRQRNPHHRHVPPHDVLLHGAPTHAVEEGPGGGARPASPQARVRFRGPVQRVRGHVRLHDAPEAAALLVQRLPERGPGGPALAEALQHAARRPLLTTLRARARLWRGVRVTGNRAAR